MIIFKNNMKRLLRDKYNLIVMVILPVIFMSLFIYAGSRNIPVRVGIIDNDDTYLTQNLIHGLEKNCIVLFLKEEEIKDGLLDDSIEYGVKIDKGFTESILSGEEAQIKAYGIKDYNALIPAKLYINNFINSARKIALASAGDEEKFKKGLEYYLKGSFEIQYENVSYSSSRGYYVQSGLGFVVMFMMYMAINAAALIGEDKKLKTYERILMSPLTLKEYTVGNILSFFAIIWIQILMLFGIMKFLFGMDFGSSAVSLLIFTFIYSAVCVSMGMAVVNLAKSLKQVYALTHLIVIPMSMLGGCFWPKEIMPDMLQRISEFVPVTWAVKGMEKILYGGNITTVGNEIVVLLLFALVFFLAGSARKSSLA